MQMNIFHYCVRLNLADIELYLVLSTVIMLRGDRDLARVGIRPIASFFGLSPGRAGARGHWQAVILCL